MQRVVRRRSLWPNFEINDPAHSIDLGLVAHAAAIETLQIDLVARGWVGLFSALLQPGANGSQLVWLESGPGGEAEIKRAYSALFGRFFGRAVLHHEHGCENLRQVRDGLEIATGVHVRKFPPHVKGDLPDWVSWNTSLGCYSICEAKGCHDRGNWDTRRPAILKHAMDQIDRVRVVDASGWRQTKNWVVASRWGTVENGKEPTIITLDPPSPGEPFSPDEADKYSRDAQAFYIADLLRGLGRTDLAKALVSPSEFPSAELDRDLVMIGRRWSYAAVLIDGSVPFPLSGPQPRQQLELLRRLSEDAGRKIALVGIERDAAEAAWRRVPRTSDRESLVTDDGRLVISGGVILSWDLDQLGFPEAA